MDNIEKYISKSEYKNAINECVISDNKNLGTLLSKITSVIEKNIVTVKLLPHWTDSLSITQYWNKMSQGNYMWNNIKLVLDENPDYFVVINKPPQNFTLTDEQKKKDYNISYGTSYR